MTKQIVQDDGYNREFEFFKNMQKSPIVMYGGAFCPPHMDHISPTGVVGRLLESVAEKVLIIPTGERTDKGYHGVSYADRRKMLELATSEFGDRVEIDSVCMDDYIDSTTIAQAKYLRREYGYDVPQVFGADIAPHMASWDRTGFVAHELPKIFLTRPGYSIEGVSNYRTVDFASRGFSSTDVRREVRRILDGDSPVSSLTGVVHEKVLYYILSHRLFTEFHHEQTLLTP